MYFWGSVCVFLRVTLLKVIAQSILFKDLTQTVGLPIIWRYKKKIKLWKLKKKKKKKKFWKWPVNWSFSELFYLFFSVPTTLNLKKNSRKSTNKKNLA